MLFIKESNDALLNHVFIEGEEEIIFNGTPNSLTGFIKISNQLNDTVKIRSIALIEKNKSGGTKNEMNVSWKLLSGEKKQQLVNLSLDPNTAPGEYLRYIEIGGERKKVKLIVQPNIEIEVNPTHFTLQNTSPDTKQSVVFTLSNTGNIDFQIPEIKHIAALDMDLLCRAFGFAFREKKAEDLMQTLNVIIGNIKQNLTDWVSVKVKEAGSILSPGKSTLVHLEFIIPKNSDQKNDYSGNIRFWDKDLSFVIKSHNI
ncbi:hypothetical protein ACLB9Y_11490 [Chryseobacterium scophthalmum]|uniref:hypothetical protein n=1 Tax=Chryseobacterium scophthalmum TaxID=59733 RepID=UPI00398BB6DD